ncbi:PaaX family transcriptional regulator [Paractinoplanes brasiliensis]|uniref:PaaX family transcriptional regulator n=1 Tax=Paractinoplanes brasiliensis TaxID=52695 RepID=A0A4R6JLW9_9ACTN|nr:PaaX family transcriptional regulator C-terminal domain-containing protein [Actinoplanes brasiliensis]TDO36827.1 PaaX family transcriptional regulator [Actinoplanes brasiliensis]GID30344.1 PaaX family transcriptional regulator [Actinoplanes brasiliensis]
MRPLLDDLDAAPGSTTSLLRTIVATSVRRIGGWIAVADLITLMRAIDVPDTRSRNALSRLKAKGLLVPESRGKVSGYRVSEAAMPMFERHDRRLYSPRFMTENDRWCLISYSVPEEQRDLRHQLRRRLSWIGCGSVSPALWICPGFLVDEVEEILFDLGLNARATVFLANEIRGDKPAPVAVALWWDLDAIRALHDDFLAAHADEVRAAAKEPSRAFPVAIRGLDSWRPIPYVDPGLPDWLLPSDWPARRSIPVFEELRDLLLPHAHAYVEQVTSGGAG